jgi:hypothetical protein
MPYLNGFKHDLFVSYAHIDNEAALSIDGKACGWVDVLVQKLEREIKQRIGTRAVDIWWDDEIDGNRPLTREIVTAIESSATLLVVMSPAYLNSKWCQRERNAFLSIVKDRIRDGSVFIVHAREIEPGTIPDEFCDLIGFPFWTKDPEVGAERPLGMPDPNEAAFVKKIYGLSHDLKKQLNKLHAKYGTSGSAPPPFSSAPPPFSSAPPPTGSKAPSAVPRPRVSAVSPTPPPPPPRQPVYVARSTEDLEEREDELKAYLDQSGFEVLPANRYPQSSADDFEQAMLAELQRCQLFLQLLSTSRGRELDFAPGRRLPQLQNEIAARRGIKRMQWCERGIDLSAIHDLQHKALLESARACGIEEFKRVAVAAANEPLATSKPPPPRAGLALFLNADMADRALAAKVSEAFATIGVDCFMPLTEGKPEEIRLDLEHNMTECDGLVLVYGAANPQWVRSQLLQGRKILSTRARPLAGLAILEGPPPEKQGLALAASRLGLLNCREGIDLGVLRRFVQELNA